MGIVWFQAKTTNLEMPSMHKCVVQFEVRFDRTHRDYTRRNNQGEMMNEPQNQWEAAEQMVRAFSGHRKAICSEAVYEAGVRFSTRRLHRMLEQKAESLSASGMGIAGINRHQIEAEVIPWV